MYHIYTSYCESVSVPRKSLGIVVTVIGEILGIIG